MFGDSISGWIIGTVLSVWAALIILACLLEEDQGNQESRSSSSGLYGSDRLSDDYRKERAGRRGTQQTYRVNRYGEIFEDD